MEDWGEEMDARTEAKRNGDVGWKEETVSFEYFKSVQKIAIS